MKFIKGLKKIKGIKAVLLLPAGIVLFYTASFTPGFIEKIYSEKVYRLIGQGLSLITGLVPFSVAELFVAIFSIYILYRLIFLIYSLIIRGQHRKQVLISFLRDFFVVVSVLYFVFVLIWGLNYQRHPFSRIADFDTRPVSVKELGDVCEELIKNANWSRTQVTEDKEGVMRLKEGKAYALRNAYKGYNEAAKLYTALGGKFGKPKGVFLSGIMSSFGICGVYFPFTGEANVNMDMPDSLVPFNICHEMAHQRGFAREDEANFIGYVASASSPDVDFKYSAYLNALVYAMNALYENDAARFGQLRNEYGSGVIRDLNARKVYWQSYEGTLNDVSSKVNNAYLKANMQKEGINSYGRMVDLLIYEYRMKKAKQEP